jgi:hypothetical protein
MGQFIHDYDSLPEDAVLGHMVITTVADAAYDGRVLEDAFNRHGLNPKFLPPALNPADAFEKASKEISGNRYAVRLNNQTLNAELMVREVARTKNVIERQITREIKDDRHRVLRYDKVAELVYYRPVTIGGRVDYSTARVRSTLVPEVTGDERTLLEGEIVKFDTAFARYRHFYDGQRMRTLLRHYLLHLNAIMLKGSVYFVHATRADELKRLRAMSQEVAPGGEMNLVLWQLPDLKSHREEVIAAFQEEASKDFMSIVTDVQKLLASRTKVGEAKYNDIKEQYATMIRKAGEYTRELKLSQDMTSSAAELALDALSVLHANVYGPTQKAG